MIGRATNEFLNSSVAGVNGSDVFPDIMSLDESPQEVTALLRDAVDRCKEVLRQKPYEEAELREAICWLKLASDEADPIFIIEGTALNHPLIQEATQMMEKLLAPLKTINPAITTLDRARDPKYAIALRGTRRGSQPGRPFDLVAMQRNYDGECESGGALKCPCIRPGPDS